MSSFFPVRVFLFKLKDCLYVLTWLDLPLLIGTPSRSTDSLVNYADGRSDHLLASGSSSKTLLLSLSFSIFTFIPSAFFKKKITLHYAAIELVSLCLSAAYFYYSFPGAGRRRRRCCRRVRCIFHIENSSEDSNKEPRRRRKPKARQKQAKGKKRWRKERKKERRRREEEGKKVSVQCFFVSALVGRQQFWKCNSKVRCVC